MSTEIRCPKCGSNQITSNKKGFSGTKAVGGALLTGFIGLLAGTIGSNKVKITCLACGKEFKPGEGKVVVITESPDKKVENQNSFINNSNVEIDPLFEEAAFIIVQNQQGSASLLQRKLKLGYNRAACIVDQLENAGIIGPSKGIKGREVLIKDTVSLENFLRREKKNNISDEMDL